MHAPRRLCLIIGLGLLAVGAVGAAGAADPAPTKFARIDLLDGRTLKNVQLVSYDAAAAKVLLIADHKAMDVPLALFPQPFANRFKHDLPEAGASASIVPPGPAPAPANQPLVRPAPAMTVPPAPAPANGGGAAADPALAAHKQAAAARAARYYEFEYPAGSGAIKVTALQIETDQPEPVAGWPGRYRTQGRAFLEFYDSAGRSFSRTTSRFEVLTEQPAGKPLTVVQFLVK
jgi:hypothetical protein